MTSFVKSYYSMSVVCSFAVIAVHTLAGLAPVEEQLSLPGVAADGNLSQIGTSESGRGTFKGTIGTHTGAIRGSIRGDVGNRSGKPQRFHNHADVNSFINSQIHDLLIDIRSSRYAVSKPQAKSQRAKVRGSFQGWVTSIKARAKYAQNGE